MRGESRYARWTTPDPLADKYYSTSPYAFCNNNPVNFVDPDGELPAPVIGAIIGGAISGTSAIINGKNFTEVIAATAGGAVDGALAASGAMFISKIAKVSFGAAGAGLGDIAEQCLNVVFGNQECIDLKDVGASTFMGIVSTGVSDYVESGLKSVAKSAIGSQSSYNAIEKEVKSKMKSAVPNPKPSSIKK